MTFSEIASAWLVPPRFPAPNFSDPPIQSRLRLPAQPLAAFPPRHFGDALGANLDAAVYDWPAADPEAPRVLLAHGWGGCGAQFVAWIAPLRAAGFHVVAYDAPGHGQSDGTTSSAPGSGGVIKALSEHYGGFTGIIAHSLGAIATTLALADGAHAERLVFLAPCATVLDSLVACGRRHGLPPEQDADLLAYFHDEFSTDLSLLTALKRVASPPPLTIFHDRADTDVDFAEAEEIAANWPNATLTEVRRAGHTRILLSKPVIADALAALKATEP